MRGGLRRAHRVRALLAVALAAVLGVALVDADEPSARPRPRPDWAAVGLGPCAHDPHQATLTAWARALGLSGPTWVSDNLDQRHLANLDDPSYWYDCWNPYLAAHPGTQLVYTVPMIISTEGDTLAREVSGAYDRHFTALAHSLDTHGESGAYLRLGWELNVDPGAGPDHGYAGGDADTARHVLWLRSWRRIVTLMRRQQARDHAPSTLRFVWNVTANEGPLADPATVFPADPARDPAPGCRAELGAASPACFSPGVRYVDMVGVDVYDSSYGGSPSCSGVRVLYPIPVHDVCTAERRANTIDDLLDVCHGAGRWAAFARSWHLPLGVPEWGLVTDRVIGGGGGGGGDDPAFVDAMVRFFRAADVTYASYYDTVGTVDSVIDDGTTPASLRRYRADLSGGAALQGPGPARSPTLGRACPAGRSTAPSPG